MEEEEEEYTHYEGDDNNTEDATMRLIEVSAQQSPQSPGAASSACLSPFSPWVEMSTPPAPLPLPMFPPNNYCDYCCD